MNAQDYAAFFEQLTAEHSIEAYREFFTLTSTFEDPFNKIQGLDAIYALFQKMYIDLHDPRFIITEIIEQESVAYLRWEFYYSHDANKSERHFEGVSRVSFNDTGKVLSHQDFWDAAHNIYETLPVLGTLIRLVKRKITSS